MTGFIKILLFSLFNDIDNVLIIISILKKQSINRSRVSSSN